MGEHYAAFHLDLHYLPKYALYIRVSESLLVVYKGLRCNRLDRWKAGH